MNKTPKPKMFEAATDSLEPNPWNSNHATPEAESRLDESMRRNGCYKPIIVRELPSGVFQIIGGEHRWRSAKRLGIATVPVASLGVISDKKAKEVGLVDNGRYGEDDPLKLGEILRELGADEVLTYLPLQLDDVAGALAADTINLDDLTIAGEDDDGIAKPEERATITHAVMRFKVPIAEQQSLEAYFQHIINTQGLKDGDSMLSAGMALIAVVALAKEAGK
jgi:ParB family transcriptional regulator, chromosome partitioning protein